MSASQEAVVAAFDEVVAERGEDWVYPQLTPQQIAEYETDDWHVEGLCRYQKEDGTAACVWGGVFQKIQPDRMPDPSATDGINALSYYLTPNSTEAFRRAAVWAQCGQDRGMPYGQMKEGFHHLLKMSDDVARAFDVEESLTEAGYPDPNPNH